MKDEERIKKSDAKYDEFVEKALEKEDQQRQKRVNVSTEAPIEATPEEHAGDTGGADSSGLTEAERKRRPEGDEANGDSARRRVAETKGEKRRPEDDDAELGTTARRRIEEKKGEKRELEHPGNAIAPKTSRTEAGEMDIASVLNEFKGRRLGVHVNGMEVMQEDDECIGGWGDTSFIDERTGQVLDPKRVKTARQEEVEFMRKIALFDVVDLLEAWDRTGKAPVTTRWVDVNKGTEEDPDVRSRFVARDFKPKGTTTGKTCLRLCRHSRPTRSCFEWRLARKRFVTMNACRR